jgi:hypothetical protein
MRRLLSDVAEDPAMRNTTILADPWTARGIAVCAKDPAAVEEGVRE